VLRAGDRAAAANLLRRAVALRPAEDPERAALLIDLGGVLREEGRFDEARRALAEALRIAEEPLAARGEVERLLTQLQIDPDRAARQATRLGGRLTRVLADADDHAGLARLWHLRGLLAWIQAQAGDAAACWRCAADEAGAARDARMLADVLGWEASAFMHGPTPVDEAFGRCVEIQGQLRGNPWAEALVMHQMAGLHAMRGAFDAAYALLDESNAALAGFSPTVDAAVSHPTVLVAMLAGDPAQAEQHLRAGRRLLEAMGERAVLASTEALLARVVLAQGRDDEADRLARRASRLTTDLDAAAQALWRRVRGIVLAGRGRAHDAERMVREAVGFMASTDYLNDHADALEDLARVYELGGDSEAARNARADAMALFVRKGNVVSAVRLERMVTSQPPS
jgi:tetratricopeptide (TPR) repeat protein